MNEPGRAGRNMATRSAASFASRRARRRVILVPSASRAFSFLAALSCGGIPIPDRVLRAIDIAYRRPFSEPVRLRPLTGTASRSVARGARASEVTALCSGFGCFGFFASRFDRRCPLAISGFLLQLKLPSFGSIRRTSRGWPASMGALLRPASAVVEPSSHAKRRSQIQDI
jgi:hypothetical protein